MNVKRNAKRIEKLLKAEKQEPIIIRHHYTSTEGKKRISQSTVYKSWENKIHIFEHIEPIKKSGIKQVNTRLSNDRIVESFEPITEDDAEFLVVDWIEAYSGWIDKDDGEIMLDEDGIRYLDRLERNHLIFRLSDDE